MSISLLPGMIDPDEAMSVMKNRLRISIIHLSEGMAHRILLPIMTILAGLSLPACSEITSTDDTASIDIIKPAAILDLSIIEITWNSLVLTWTAPGDDGKEGIASSYEIRLSERPIVNCATWKSASPVENTMIPKQAGQLESFQLSELAGGRVYYTAIRALDDADNRSPLGKVVSDSTHYPPGWFRGPPMLERRGYATSVVLNGSVHVIGGFHDQISASHEVFDPSTGNWTYRASMPTPRYNAGAAVINGKIYVVGGYNSDSPELDVLEIYDSTTDSWITGPSMPTGRKGVGVEALGDKLYVIGGGRADWSRLRIMEIYDSSSETWYAGMPMHIERSSVSTAVVDGKILVMGGFHNESIDNFEIFDPSSGFWTVQNPLPVALRSATSAVLDGKVFLFGGLGGGEAASNDLCMVYEPITQTWEILNRMPNRRFGAVAEVMGDRIIIAGGCTGLAFNLPARVDIFDPSME